MTENELIILLLGTILIGGHLVILFSLLKDKLTKQTQAKAG